MAKANVYVDGFNLYYGALKDSPFKWLDLSALCRKMLPADTIQQIWYYTAIVSARPGDPGLPTRQQMYLRALRTIPNLTIVLGHFLTHPTRMVLSGTNPPQKVWVDRTEEKGSDVNIAAHLLRDAFRNGFELGVLITNDSDLLEPVRIVRRELGLPIGILNPQRQNSQVLMAEATFMKRIRQSEVAACQFARTLTDNKGQFHKPPTW